MAKAIEPEKTNEKNNNDPSFETALSELESIVAKLESGQLPLDQSLSLFEKGIALSSVCSGKLKIAEQQVEELIAQLAKQKQENA